MFWCTLFLLAIGVVAYKCLKKCKNKKVDLEKYRKDGWFGRNAIKGLFKSYLNSLRDLICINYFILFLQEIKQFQRILPRYVHLR